MQRKYFNLFLIYLLISPYSFSQKNEIEIDKAYIKCQYKHTWQFDTLENIVRDDLLILQIGKNISKCYSYYTFQSDSLIKTGNFNKVFRESFSKAVAKDGINATNFPHKRMGTYVYKNYPAGKMTITDGVNRQNYIYEDDLNTQNWQISDSTKSILDYPCQMAESDFRGRHWTAWFAPDIPVSDGPWKFGGLPGLIMEVYDRGQQYHFTIIGLEKVNDIPIVFTYFKDRAKYEKTGRKDFLKARKRYLMDMSGYIEMETGIDLSDGTPAKVMRYDLIERDYK